jgi:hypothetical protein
MRLRGQTDRNSAIFCLFPKLGASKKTKQGVITVLWKKYLNGLNDTFSGGQNDKNLYVLLDAYDSNLKFVCKYLVFQKCYLLEFIFSRSGLLSLNLKVTKLTKKRIITLLEMSTEKQPTDLRNLVLKKLKG